MNPDKRHKTGIDRAVPRSQGRSRSRSRARGERRDGLKFPNHDGTCSATSFVTSQLGPREPLRSDEFEEGEFWVGVF